MVTLTLSVQAQPLVMEIEILVVPAEPAVQVMELVPWPEVIEPLVIFQV